MTEAIHPIILVRAEGGSERLRGRPSVMRVPCGVRVWPIKYRES